MIKMYKIEIFFLLSLAQGKPQISLEYKPTRPFYQPQPAGSHLGQIVPPGKPWPESQQGYQNFNGPNPDSIVDRIKETEPSSTTTGFEWPSISEDEHVISTSGPKEPNDLIPTERPANGGTINLEYQPTRPPYHPNPGNNLGQIVPPSEPWPAKPEDYQNFGETTKTPDLVDRIKEQDSVSSSTDRATTSSNQEPTAINIEYKPTRPFYYPKPGNTVSQIVPPGEPWPQGSAGYQNFTQNPPPYNLVDRIKETESKPTSTTPAGFIWHSNLPNTEDGVAPKQPNDLLPSEGVINTRPVTLADRLKDTVSSKNEQASTSGTGQKESKLSLDYKPNTPFHATGGNTLSPHISTGKPWPASAEGYQNFSQTGPNLVNRIQENTSRRPESTTTSKRIILDYQPTRPTFHPNPGNNIAPIVPPGKPWPSSVAGYQNFTQLPSPRPIIEDRIKEPVPSTVQQAVTPVTVAEKAPVNLEYQPSRPPFYPNSGDTLAPGNPWPNSPEGNQNVSQSETPSTFVNRIKETTTVLPTSAFEVQGQNQPISLEYQPNPPFHASGGNTLSPHVSPGAPWPDSAEGYQNFSQTTAPDIINRIQENTSSKPQSITTRNILDYQPTRPTFHPNPGNNIAPIVPPGDSWPNSVEGYQNFSQIPSPRPIIQDRIKDSNLSSSQQPVTPPGTFLNGSEGYQTTTIFSLLLDRLQELVNKRKMQTTSEAPQSSFIWVKETSSEISPKVVNRNSEVSSSESSSVEISTLTKTIPSTTEGKLYTSPPHLLNRFNQENILEPSALTVVQQAAVPKQEVHGRPFVQSAPLVLVPFNWSPSHYVFYI